jgi:6-phosphogluconolactonase (cycloisomerase 2 family)
MTPDIRRLLVGCYGPPRGSGAGITLVEHDRGAGTLRALGTAAQTPSPSTLAASADGRTVFAVEEHADGAVHSFRWDGESRLAVVSSRASGGADPCQLLVHPSGRWLLAANYSGSTVSAHPIGADGTLGPRMAVLPFSGKGPDPDRQASPHPHMVAAVPGTTELAIADLGSDCIRRVEFSAESGTFGRELPPVGLPPGTGPRQVVFAAGGRVAYVLGELSGQLITVDWLGGQPRVAGSQLASGQPLPEGNAAAALELSRDGRRLYASHRGADTIVAFDLADPRHPRLDSSWPAGGSSPRHIARDGAWLYVACEMAGIVAAHHADGRAVTVVAVPSATFVLLEPAGGVQGEKAV